MQNAGPFALALVFALVACGGNGGTPPPPTPVFTSLSLSPSSPALVLRDTLQMSATARDQNGAAMNLTGATYELVAGSGNAVTVSPTGQVVAVATGSAQVRASLTSGGTTRTATATVNVNSLAVSPTVTASGTGATFTPDTTKIAVNGTVTWSFPGPETHNVTFLAAAPPGGNITDRNSGTEARQFTTAGRFSYRCTRHAGMDGAVVVRTP